VAVDEEELERSVEEEARLGRLFVSNTFALATFEVSWQ
jgi:hypothetical protein